jgi:hypothetical protein
MKNVFDLLVEHCRAEGHERQLEEEAYSIAA